MTRIAQHLPLSIWAAASALSAVHVAVFAASVLAVPDTMQAQFIPDDGYYYVGLARGFVRFGGWSWDAGHSTTSGFHPLLAYLLSLLYALVRPGTAEFVNLAIGLSALLTLSALVIAWLAGLRLRQPYYFMALAILASSPNFTFNSVSMMEWPLVVLVAALYCIYWYRYGQRDRPVDRVVLFALGFGASLARFDSGLLPLSLAAVACGLWYFRGSGAALRTALAGLSGTVAGAVLVMLNSYAFTGAWLQGSAEMKVHWAQAGGADGPRFFAYLAALLTPEVFLLLPIAALLVAILALRRRLVNKSGGALRPEPPGPGGASAWDAALAIAAALCACAYVLVYAFSAGIGTWYTANLVVPMFVVLVALTSAAGRLLDRRIVMIFTSMLVAALVARNLASYSLAAPEVAPFPWQHLMVESGKYLDSHPLDARVGSWNAGIMGYYQGGTLTNLDGLMNNEVYSYVVSNQLPAYLSREHIGYILDFEPMLTDEGARVVGGYNDSTFLASLQPVRTLSDERQVVWKHLILYRIVP